MFPRLTLHRNFVALAGCAGTLTLTLALTACRPSSPSKSPATPQQTSTQTPPRTTPKTTPHPSARARRRQLEADARRLDAIPPPAKLRYTDVSSSSHWQNPFLTVQQKTVQLRIPAPARSRRSRRARRRRPAPLWKTTILTPAELPAALAALPQANWPYGRVVALRDDLSGPPRARVQVRQNEEKILNLLNDLGVVTYEWPRHRKP